jgi:hypothetical protein
VKTDPVDPTSGASSTSWRRSGTVVSAALLALLLTPSRGAAQVELLKLLPPADTPSDSSEDDDTGRSVCIHRNRAIVGAPGDDDAGIASGTAYIYDTTTGRILSDLHHPDAVAFDYFGCSVAISGDFAVVGAEGRDDVGSECGAAYIFDVATGQLHRKLLPNVLDTGDRFGSSVALEENLAVIGAFADDDNGQAAGAAYVFDVRTGLQLLKLVTSDGKAGDFLGYSVAISGDRALIGAMYDDDHAFMAGSAYLFDVRTGQELHKLYASDAAPYDHFGCSVAISGDRAIVGAYRDGTAGPFTGSAYVFDVDTGQQLYKLQASDGASRDFFGSGVAISGNRALVGAWGSGALHPKEGGAYLFDAMTGAELYRIMASDPAPLDLFGNSVSLWGDRALIGALLCDAPAEDSGAAYLFQVVDWLFVEPEGSFESEGNIGGPFYPVHCGYTLYNTSSADLPYKVVTDQPWVLLSSTGGIIPAGGEVVVYVGFAPLAESLGLGLHLAQVDFVNLATHMGDTSRQVVLDVQEGLLVRFHRFPLNSNPGWDCEGQWAFGHPTGEGGDEILGPDPPRGHTGLYVYGYNLGGDYDSYMYAYHLTSGPIDCSDSTSTTLRFWRWLNVETSLYDHADVRVSKDGSVWHDVWSNPTSGSVNDEAWTQVEYDISAVADGESTVYLRWTMGSTDYLYAASGWNIDDIEIWGAAPPAPGIAYCSGESGCPCNNDNTGELSGAGCANGVFASGAYLTATGTASISADTLVLRATHQEPNNSGLYFQGTSDLSPGMAWGDGLRCAGGAIRRLQVVFAEADGSSLTTIPIGAAGAASAGDTHYYQLWYRNVDTPPCGAGVNDFNSSNGYTIRWLP